MAAFGTIYLDTNIFIMAFETRNDASDRLSEIFARIDSRSAAGFLTSELTLSELLVRPIRENDAQGIDQYETLFAPDHWLQARPVTRSTLFVAATLRAQNAYLKLPDAIHVATALHENCSHILTNDRGIKGTYSTHPRAKASLPTTPLTAIRPDTPTLSSILQSLAA
jgi:predicted nucleic acid-binding protein